MTDKKYKVILVKSGMCGHCKNFEPIFELARKMKIDGFDDVDFKDYDFAGSDLNSDMEKFKSKYPSLFNKIEGYPTVFTIVDEGDKVHSGMVDHTVVSDDIPDTDKQYKEAAIRFIQNVSNGLKTLESDGKSLFLESETPQTGAGISHKNNLPTNNSNCCSLSNTHSQNGGNPYYQNNNYKNKYLKYKNKYLELKNKLNF